MTAYIQRDNPTLREFGQDPERINAVQWTEDNFDAVRATFPDVDARITPKYRQLVITTHEGEIAVKVGYWIIRGIGATWTYVMFPQPFEDRYRLLEDADSSA